MKLKTEISLIVPTATENTFLNSVANFRSSFFHNKTNGANLKIHLIKPLFAMLLLWPLIALADTYDNVTDKDIIELIDARSVGAQETYRLADGTIMPIADTSKCAAQHMKEQWRLIAGYMKQGNTDMAHAAGLLNANYSSACALVKTKYPQKEISNRISDLGLAGWSEQIGSFLAASILTGSSDRTTVDQTMKFLSYAKHHGKKVDDLINQIKQRLGTNAPPRDAPALTGTAVSIVGKLASNAFSFEQHYLGKVIQATGKVIQINGANDRATVKLLGNTTKSSDQLGWRDSIFCKVTNQEFLPKVGNLETGKNATVRGTYKKGSFGEIELQNCQIK